MILIKYKIEENPRYLKNKNKFNSYLIENPFVAMKKGIKPFSCNEHLICLSFIVNLLEFNIYLILFLTDLLFWIFNHVLGNLFI